MAKADERDGVGSGKGRVGREDVGLEEEMKKKYAPLLHPLVELR